MFNEEVDAFHPLFTTGAIVEITRPQVKLGNPKFTKNRYELALSRNSGPIKPVIDYNRRLFSF